ncbi:hypothetical protein BDV95DRAFT_593227 [Massariosphaeria phaeospora]|uniref:PD-(D/E)XK nuclease-like domain-containing protein n=1 Tax=Massariosphaeria phaeospora TaxID=100035 RepID=A0A7C8I7S8_9PLEO|nr:hypothetical protein BDV95DRAFT_593227 [Massariosphaeria phaeospora]
MACAHTWLAAVHAADGHLEPPPEPDIPADYLQKPRRGPAPTAYLPRASLASPPPSSSASKPIPRPKRRRAALAEIEPPNQKRQRTLNAPTRTMSPRKSPSPARKSSRQTAMAGKAGKAQMTIEEAPAVAMQRVVDPDRTPRPARPKRAVRPAPPVPDLHAWPAPVLMPSGSEGVAEDLENSEDAENAEIESSHASTNSKRSRSPTRRMIDLQIATKPIIPKTVTSSEDVPQDVRALYKAVRAVARMSKGVVPLGIEIAVKEHVNDDFDDLEDCFAKTPSDRTHKQLEDEFKAMWKIRNGTAVCEREHLHEPSWNELVHSQMLEQAVVDRPGFAYYNITTARVIKELVPDNKFGELLKGKMIDYAVTLGPPLIPTAHVVNGLAASPRKLQRTCNPSEYSPLCYNPVALSIETKSPDGRGENGEVQLAVWALAYFNRLRQLIQDPVTMTLPMLLVTNAQWKLYFASDLAHEIHFIHAVDIGTTTDIIGCYTILKALRLVLDMVEQTFPPWFLEGVQPE